MRVHRLELTAFGPFPGTEVIDLDELSAAGVFLLTGPTGAGKTTILDAICFGLYGSVPGDRNAAKDLRSHHAPPTAGPRVEVEVTIRGRRFRLVRSPAWSRPSRRATSGFADQHARATIAEHVDGEWRPLSNRLDEVGHLVTTLLGMNRDQFCQVVMLPQGQFQTFLQAGARDRHDVLEALFATSRFVRIEKWLAEHRRRTDRDYAEHEAGLRELLARVHEVYEPGATTPSSDLDADVTLAAEHQVGWPAVADTIARWHGETAAELVSCLEATELQLEHAKAARHRLDEARELVSRQERVREARKTLDALDATAGEIEARTEAIARARAAALVNPFVELAQHARDRVDRSTDHVRRRQDRLTLADPTSPHDSAEGAVLETWLEHRRAELASVEALVPVENRVVELEAEVAELVEAVVAAGADVATAEAAAGELPVLLDAARGERDRARALADRLDSARATHLEAVDVDEAARLTDDRVGVVEALSDARRERQSAALDTRERWLLTRERHLAGQAALLAAELSEGRACAVCGSRTHPQPATLTSDHATSAEVAAAEAAHASAEQLYAEAGEAYDDAVAELAALRTLAHGRTVPEAHARLQAAVVDLRATRAAAEALDGLDMAVTAAAEQLGSLEAATTEAVAVQAAISTRLDERRGELRRQRRTLRKRLGGAGSVDVRVAALRSVVDAATALVAAHREQSALTNDARTRETALAERLADSPFADPESVVAALMTTTDIANAETLNRTAADARAAAAKTLAEPALVEASILEQPDLGALAVAADDAAVSHQRADRTVVALTHRVDRLGDLSVEVTAEVAALAPLAQARDLAARVAAMVAGTSADNVTRTKLSHYVLSARLRQVVDAANVRLAGIAGGRYQLASSVDRGVGDTRGGLGLRVVDAYTGASRDPATLSGGETFYVSLALALGLADLVRDEIGGAELSTLFVDEGFGTLDADTLDEVMDELDTLRSGGRSVGIVSHLPDLRQRIPTRLEVVATPSGSHVSSA